MKYKIVLCGDKGVGKTSYLNRIIHHQYIKKYIPTSKLSIETVENNNDEYNFWDMPSSNNSLRDCYFIQSDLIVLMFDLTDESSYDSLYDWHRDIRNVSKDIPIVILGNKKDSNDIEVKSKYITFHREYSLKLFEISCKTNYNVQNSLNTILEIVKNSKKPT